ncbi:hypothetical protein AB1L05_22845 [Cytobacillus horneckiae]
MRENTDHISTETDNTESIEIISTIIYKAIFNKITSDHHEESV